MPERQRERALRRVFGPVFAAACSAGPRGCVWWQVLVLRLVVQCRAPRPWQLEERRCVRVARCGEVLAALRCQAADVVSELTLAFVARSSAVETSVF
jgi:hypothetical protein